MDEGLYFFRSEATIFQKLGLWFHTDDFQPTTDPQAHTLRHTLTQSLVCCVWCSAGGGAEVSKHHRHEASKDIKTEGFIQSGHQGKALWDTESFCDKGRVQRIGSGGVTFKK